MKKIIILSMLVAQCFLFDVYAACSFSDSNGDSTHFFDGGEFYLCGGIDREKAISLDVINTFAKDRKTINIPQNEKEDRFHILDVDTKNELALIETYYLTKPTKDNPSSSTVGRYFLLELVSGNLTAAQPALPAGCKMVAPQLAINGTAFIYPLLPDTQRYDPEKREWSHSGCEEDAGLYLFTFKNSEIKRLSQTFLTSASAKSPLGNRVAHHGPKDPETGIYYDRLVTFLDDDYKTISVNDLLNKALPDEKVLLSTVSEFIDEETVVGVYFTGEGKTFERAVLYRLSLTSGTAVILDSALYQASTININVTSLSDDRSHLAYNIGSSSGTKTKVVSIADGRIVTEWDRQISSFRWGPEMVFVPIEDNEKRFEIVELATAKRQVATLNPLDFHTIQNEPSRQDRVFLNSKSKEYADINFQSITFINGRILFIADVASHFCNSYLFSSAPDGSDIRLMSGEVLPETCGALQIVKRDEKTVVFLNDTNPKQDPQFLLVGSVGVQRLLYQP